jgi:hypothetical protein
MSELDKRDLIDFVKSKIFNLENELEYYKSILKVLQGGQLTKHEIIMIKGKIYAKIERGVDYVNVDITEKIISENDKQFLDYIKETIDSINENKEKTETISYNFNNEDGYIKSIKFDNVISDIDYLKIKGMIKYLIQSEFLKGVHQ